MASPAFLAEIAEREAKESEEFKKAVMDWRKERAEGRGEAVIKE